MKLAFLFLAALAYGQDSQSGHACYGASQEQCDKIQASWAASDKHDQQILELRQEIQRLTVLLNFYQQQYFAMQAKMIEQQIAPKEPSKPKPPAQGEPAK